jgi:hypothetical protein
MFRSRGYLVWVAVEVTALVVGNVILGASGNSAYVAAWTAWLSACTSSASDGCSRRCSNGSAWPSSPRPSPARS